MDIRKSRMKLWTDFPKIEDSFISRYLLREGESLDEAKERLKREKNRK